jgi:hypothetical protein
MIFVSFKETFLPVSQNNAVRLLFGILAIESKIDSAIGITQRQNYSLLKRAMENSTVINILIVERIQAYEVERPLEVFDIVISWANIASWIGEWLQNNPNSQREIGEILELYQYYLNELVRY